VETNCDDFVRVRQGLAAYTATARAAALVGRELLGGAPDTEDMGDEDGFAGTPAIVYRIRYENAAGEESERTITVRRLRALQSGAAVIDCLCHRDHVSKTFRIDRIIEVSCVVTGEVFPDPIIFFTTHPLLTRPNDAEAFALQASKHEVALLVVAGACDGRFIPDEQDQVLIHVFDRHSDLQLNEDRLRGQLALFAPDLVAYRTALHETSRHQLDSRMLLRSLRRLIDADGIITREEVVYATEIERVISIT
jgi:hypothetical protein